MAVLPHLLIEAALAAPLHLQIAVRSVRAPDQTPGNAIVTGEVVRVFRGADAGVVVGDVVELAIGVVREGDRPPPSGRRWTSSDALEETPVIEAWAHVGATGVLSLGGEQYAFLEVASDTPRLDYTAKDALPPRSDDNDDNDDDDDQPSGRRRADIVFALSMVAFAVVGVFCVVSAFSVLLR